MSETWGRDDGWEIIVTQREPLVASHIPMTVDTVGREVTYEVLVEAMRAYGYGLVSQ